jgi:hypothetical protein
VTDAGLCHWDWVRLMDTEAITRIEEDHRPMIIWQNGATGWRCVCGGPWPCRVYLLADDARQHRARVARDTRPAAS